MSGSPATIDGLATPFATAIEQAARVLRQARRVLVTGLADAPLEAIAAACDLAESLGAAIDAAAPEIASPAGPILPRAGGVTADLEELRDRADLVIAWFCDGPAVATAFTATAVGTASGRSPRLLVVGPEPLPGWEHVPLDSETAVDAARVVHLLLVGHEPLGEPVAANCLPVADAIRAATCVGFLTQPAADPLGLPGWALARAVRFLTHEKPAFMVPLAPVFADRLDNAAGAVALLTWRYGAGGGIARADRHGGNYRPAECDAVRLIERGEVDAVVAVGRLPAGVEAAIAQRASDLRLVRLDCRAAEPPGAAGTCVHVRSCLPTGTVLGRDGREITVGNPTPATDSLAAILAALHRRLAEGSA